MKYLDVIGLNKRNRDFIMRYNTPRDIAFAKSKLDTKKWLHEIRMPTPNTLAVIHTTRDARTFLDSASRPSGFVIKPNRGAMGNGVQVVSTPFGPDQPVTRLRAQLYWQFCRILAGEFSGSHAVECALVEERVGSEAFALPICGFASADLRILCCNGRIVLAMLRLPTQESAGRSNLHQGGVGVGIDLESGAMLHAIHKHKVIKNHPDTGVRLTGNRVPNWLNQVLPLSTEMATKCPIKYCGLDLMID